MYEKVHIQAHVNNYLSQWPTCTIESHDLITILGWLKEVITKVTFIISFLIYFKKKVSDFSETFQGAVSS